MLPMYASKITNTFRKVQDSVALDFSLSLPLPSVLPLSLPLPLGFAVSVESLVAAVVLLWRSVSLSPSSVFP